MTRPDRRTATIALTGDVDGAGVEAVRRLASVLAEDAEQLAIDVSGLTFRDEGGRQALESVVQELTGGRAG